MGNWTMRMSLMRRNIRMRSGMVGPGVTDRLLLRDRLLKVVVLGYFEFAELY